VRYHMRKGRRQKSHLGFFRSVSSAFAAPLRSPETMCARAASLSCRLSARRGSAGRFGSVPRLARTIFLAMMVGFTSAQTICTNTCSNYANQGTCDDGGPGAEFNGFCAYGTDCADCGPRQATLELCSSGCGACDYGAVRLTSPGTTNPNQWANEYYYKTTWTYTCSACSGVASGGDMYIYQAYDVTGRTSYNAYLWFDCSNGRWTRSVVNAGADSETCPYKFACAGPYPAGTMIDPAWSSCPYGGAPICPVPPPPPPFPPGVTFLSICPSCGSCSMGDYLENSGFPGEYFYKTDYFFRCSACASVVSGGEMHIYQAYDGTGESAHIWNVYLWFDCTNGKWTRSVVPVGYGPCPDQFSCAGPYPAGTVMGAQSAWSSCPYGGAPICPAPGPSPPDSDELIGFLALIIIGVLLLVTFLCGGICVCLGVCVLPICCRPNPNPGPNSRAGLEMREVTVQGYDMGPNDASKQKQTLSG
jgi:hypothetical protein